MRAGGGVFFDTGTQPAIGAFNGIGFDSSVSSQNTPLPVTQSQLNFSTAIVPPYTNTTVFAFPSHLQLPFSFQWNVGLEKALNRNQSLTVSYVGANGHRLLARTTEKCQPVQPYIWRCLLFSRRSDVQLSGLAGEISTHDVHGLQALASYTWAHALDYGSTDPAFPLIRGNSDLDVRQNLEAAVSWNLPTPSGKPSREESVG